LETGKKKGRVSVVVTDPSGETGHLLSNCEKEEKKRKGERRECRTFRTYIVKGRGDGQKKKKKSEAYWRRTKKRFLHRGVDRGGGREKDGQKELDTCLSSPLRSKKKKKKGAPKKERRDLINYQMAVW